MGGHKRITSCRRPGVSVDQVHRPGLDVEGFREHMIKVESK
jgi:hypothetical protein